MNRHHWPRFVNPSVAWEMPGRPYRTIPDWGCGIAQQICNVTTAVCQLSKQLTPFGVKGRKLDIGIGGIVEIVCDTMFSIPPRVVINQCLDLLLCKTNSGTMWN